MANKQAKKPTPFLNKSLDGQTVYLLPHGNNVRRGVAGGVYKQVIKAKIIKVNRVNVEFQEEGISWVNKYRKIEGDPRYISSGYNSGYYVYLSLDEIEEVRMCEEVYRRLRNDTPTLTPDQAKAIKALFDWE